MAEIKISAAARDDMMRIGDFSADRFGHEVADAYARGFNEAFALLTRYPEVGELRPDYGKGVRSKVHRSHRIIYRIRGGTVFVERILHHSQNVRANLRK